MHKHLLSALIIFTLTINLYSQPLSRVYNIINGNEFGTEILVGDEGYFVLTKGICDPGSGHSKLCLPFLSLNNNGENNNNFIFVNRMRVSSPRQLQIINDTIYVFGYNDFVVPWEWIIFKTNMKGDSLGKIVYSDFKESKVVGRGLSYSGEYLYLIGNTWDTDTKGQLIVVKMDKQGNVIKKERFLNVTKSDYNYQMRAIVALDDGNFVLVYSYIYDRGSIPGIIKFDKDLNYIWHKEFNHNSNDHSHPGITALQGGSVLVNWGIYVPEVIEDWKKKYGRFGTTPNTLYKIDKDGNTIWSDTMWTLIPESHNPAPIGPIYMMEQTKNGDIIGVGKYKIYKSPLKQRAWIFKYSADGELLWQKMYEDKNFNVSYSRFSDIMEAPNGDIVCTGQMSDDDAWGGDADYTWVLRVDSDGCFESGCGVEDTVQLVYTESELITDTDEISIAENNTDELYIYPNPAQDKIKIVIGNKSNLQTSTIGVKWSIFDFVGREIMTGSADSRYDFSISGLSGLKSGVYFLKVEDKYGTINIGKFVIE